MHPSSSDHGAHYNAAGQLIASGEMVDGERYERCHLPFEGPADPPSTYLRHPDHMVRVTAERIVENLMRCMELRYKC